MSAINVCPDCEADLQPSARRCKCGWQRPAASRDPKGPAPRPSLLALGPPMPPTPAERERARAALAAIRAFADRVTLRRGVAKRRPGEPETEAERIIACQHPRFGEPESAKRYGCGGYARRCRDCGFVDLVQLTPAQVEALALDAARLPPAAAEAVTLHAEPGSEG